MINKNEKQYIKQNENICNFYNYKIKEYDYNEYIKFCNETNYKKGNSNYQDFQIYLGNSFDCNYSNYNNNLCSYEQYKKL